MQLLRYFLVIFFSTMEKKTTSTMELKGGINLGLVYRHVTSLSVAQGHINVKILEILKPSRRRKKNNWFAHNFLSIKQTKKNSSSMISYRRITL